MSDVEELRMPALEKLNMYDSILEQLRCALCKGYLSSAPVQLLPDGRSICGLCSPSIHDGSTYRQLALEAVLSQTSFPCQFKGHGCEESIRFGHANEHEDSCPYRPFSCPSLPNGPNGTCSWVGSMKQMPDHFSQDHPTMFTQKVEFKIEVDHDGEGILLAMVDGAAFISKFVYKVNDRNLYYEIRSLGGNIQESLYKIKLVNGDYGVILKGDKCSSYDCLFPDMDNGRTLNIVNLLPILDNPHEIIFVIKVTVVKSDHPNTSEGQLLDNCASSDGTVTDNALKSADVKVEDNFSNTTSSCSWKDCKFVGTPDEISEHEIICQFRLCKCTVESCEDLYKPEAILTHLLSHGFYYISEGLGYKMVFSGANEVRSIFSLKYNGIIYITHEAREYRQSYHEITIESHTYNDKNINNTVSAILEYEHPKCKFKSEVFTAAAEGFIFGHCYLPSCIKTSDEFSVTLRIF